LTNESEADLAAISPITAAPTLLEVTCRTTGMGFAAVARVSGLELPSTARETRFTPGVLVP